MPVVVRRPAAPARVYGIQYTIDGRCQPARGGRSPAAQTRRRTRILIAILTECPGLCGATPSMPEAASDKPAADAVGASPDENWTDIGAAHQSLHGAVMDSLRQAILQGRFKPGERLTEAGLAEIFDVSRNPIREALRALEVEGFIEKHPRRGARVRLLSDEEADEIIEARAELEGINARNAAKRCNDESRPALQKLLSDGNEALERGDQDTLKQLNQQFHGMVADVGRNRYLADYIRSLRERTLWLFAAVPGERVVATWREHAGILDAVISGDAELAALLAARHVRKVGETVREHVQAAGEPDAASG